MWFLLCALLLGSGCALIYRQDVQQGNFIEQKAVDQLRPGMTKRQVALILGTPAITSPFRQNRWDYVSSFAPGARNPVVKRLTLYFEDNQLVRIEGDYRPGGGS